MNDFVNKSFAIHFTSKLNETFVITQPIKWNIPTNFDEKIEFAPEKAPKQKVVDDCSVTITHRSPLPWLESVGIDNAFTGTAVHWHCRPWPLSTSSRS